MTSQPRHAPRPRPKDVSGLYLDAGPCIHLVSPASAAHTPQSSNHWRPAPDGLAHAP